MEENKDSLESTENSNKIIVWCIWHFHKNEQNKLGIDEGMYWVNRIMCTIIIKT